MPRKTDVYLEGYLRNNKKKRLTASFSRVSDAQDFCLYFENEEELKKYYKTKYGIDIKKTIIIKENFEDNTVESYIPRFKETEKYVTLHNLKNVFENKSNNYTFLYDLRNDSYLREIYERKNKLKNESKDINKKSYIFPYLEILDEAYELKNKILKANANKKYLSKQEKSNLVDLELIYSCVYLKKLKVQTLIMLKDMVSNLKKENTSCIRYLYDTYVDENDKKFLIGKKNVDSFSLEEVDNYSNYINNLQNYSEQLEMPLTKTLSPNKK